MRTKLLLVVVACAVSSLSSVARTHDYEFGVTGVVTDVDGTPLHDAEVALEVNGPVYAGVTLVRRQRQLTNSTGGFVFIYTTHAHGVKYTITVRKQGFEPQTLSGSAPPAGHHTIRLKKATEKDSKQAGGAEMGAQHTTPRF